MQTKQTVTVLCTGFSVEVGEDWFSVSVKEQQWFRFPVTSALSCADETDTDLGAKELSQSMQGTVQCFVWKTASTLWDTKEYCLEVSPEYLRFYLRVSGKKAPSMLHFCCGDAPEQRTGIRYGVSEYFLPTPLFSSETHYYSMAESAEIATKLMVPPLYCLPYRKEDTGGWFGLGIAAKPGNFRFEAFRSKTEHLRLQLCLPLAVSSPQNGMWETPSLLGCFGESEWEVLEAYIAWHYKNGCTAHQSQSVRWWHGPFFCGWGEQAVLARREGCSIYEAANQRLYTEMSAHLDKIDLHPTAIILDDKWQRFYGEALPDAEKWPDLRVFTEREHAKGRKTVLWFKCWDCEGLPDEECIHLAGKAVAADPTHPAYRTRLKNTLRQLLSDAPGCFDCDGLKLDFADCFPKEREILTYQKNVGGIELLHTLFSLIYTSVKEIKPDALINASVCHPYLAQFTDQARLHDYNANQHLIRRCMSFRHRLYHLVFPNMPIDTDFPAFADHDDSMEYIRFAPQLGVPDLYRLSDTEDCVFSEKDLRELRLVWQQYSKKIAADFEKEGQSPCQK